VFYFPYYTIFRNARSRNYRAIAELALSGCGKQNYSNKGKATPGIYMSLKLSHNSHNSLHRIQHVILMSHYQMTHLIRKLRILVSPIHPKNKHNAYNFAYHIYVAVF
jgi:hypothetical protein